MTSGIFDIAKFAIYILRKYHFFSIGFTACNIKSQVCYDEILYIIVIFMMKIESVETFLVILLMKSYCLSGISPSRTLNRSDRSLGYRLCYVTERYVPRIGYLKERVRT
jgi:hypothetical protein